MWEVTRGVPSFSRLDSGGLRGFNGVYIGLFAVFFRLLPPTATAVPTTTVHQGRLLDSSGVPLTGVQTVSFSIYDASACGTELWSEDLTLDFDNGYFSTTLGETVELDAGVLAGDSGRSAELLGQQLVSQLAVHRCVLLGEAAEHDAQRGGEPGQQVCDGL